MTLVLTTAPVSEPLTTAEAKAHLNVDTSDDDTLIDTYVAGARQAAETFLKMSLLETVWAFSIDGFPPEIRLPVGPVFSTNVPVITYIDTAGASQTLATSGYKVSYGDNCVIRPAYGETWPETRSEMDAVTVSFTAGWPGASSVPPAILMAIKVMIGRYYETRSDVVVGATATDIEPLAAKNLLMPFVRSN